MQTCPKVYLQEEVHRRAEYTHNNELREGTFVCMHARMQDGRAGGRAGRSVGRSVGG